ncbi:hypothetical protein OF83DRAFT_1176092 [Amylostereum chailletii]|nr:hypothetical protein OF83DRAFT_1176092 [Amylostereum chailletii]
MDYAPPPGPPPSTEPPPPQWAPAPERSHTDGLYNEASEVDYERAEAFCATYPLDPPKLIPSAAIERIQEHGCGAWGLEWPNNPRFFGNLQTDLKSGLAGAWRVRTEKGCKDCCLLSDLPIMGGMYDVKGKRGVYYEVKIHKMEGVIAVGTACKPYPSFRMPGWNRQSAALHLDDLRKFFEDPDGGRDYDSPLKPDSIYPGCIIGCGYEFSSGALFFTYNGARLTDAFKGIYVPRIAQDVYAAIGVDGENELEVNFGSAGFVWKEGNDWAWRVEGHVGQMIGAQGSGSAGDDQLPAYTRFGG